MIIYFILYFIIFYILVSKKKKYEHLNNEINIDYYVIHIKDYTKPQSKLRIKNIKENEIKLKQKINFFDGIDGKKIDFNNLEKYHPQLKNNYITDYLGEIGCYLSHFNLINNLEENNNYSVIFEDDFFINKNDLHDNILEIINKIKIDFDILYLSNNYNNHGINYIDNIYFPDKNNVIYGTQAYIIKNKNKSKIINNLLNINEPIDVKFKSLIDSNKLNSLIIFPIIVYVNKNMGTLVLEKFTELFINIK